MYDDNEMKSRKRNEIQNRFWMKSKPFGFDEIKSVFLSAAGDFICNSRFHPRSGFLPLQNGFN